MAEHLPEVLPIHERLAAVSGIVTPSRVPAGHQARIPTGIFGGYGPHGTKKCILCGSTTIPEDVKEHFIACIHANGNPIGAHWYHNFIDVPSQEFDESYHSDEPSTASPTPQAHMPMHQFYLEDYHKYGLNTRIPADSLELTQAFAMASKVFISPTGPPETPNLEHLTDNEARLALVNGVVIPSQVPSGQRPDQGRMTGRVPKNQDIKCNICGRASASRQAVRSHFVLCVVKNGNPYGVRWDDAYSSDNLRNFPDRDAKVGKPIVPQPANSNSQIPDPSTNIIPQPTQQDKIHINTSAPTSRLEKTFPQAPLTIADRESAMSVLSNGKLLEMLQAWQNVIWAGQEASARMDIGFLDVMTELQERRLIDGYWLWSVDDGQIDKTLVRLAAKSSGSEN